VEPIVLMGLLVVVYGGYVSWMDCRQGVLTALHRCMARRRAGRQRKRGQTTARHWGRMYVAGLDDARLCSRRRFHVPC
jgi:hypothetical protein